MKFFDFDKVQSPYTQYCYCCNFRDSLISGGYEKLQNFGYFLMVSKSLSFADAKMYCTVKHGRLVSLFSRLTSTVIAILTFSSNFY